MLMSLQLLWQQGSNWFTIMVIKKPDDIRTYVVLFLTEILITAGGENVAPVPIEEAVKEHLPCVSNCMVVGDRKKFLSVLLTLKVSAFQLELMLAK